MPPSKIWHMKENRPSVTICALSLIIIGIVMTFAGGLVTYIYFTEITPPNYDAYYQRYVGSSFPRIIGILVLMAGLTLFWGASIFLVYVNWRDNNNVEATDAPNVEEYFFDNVEENKVFKTKTNSTRQQPIRTYVKESYIG